MCAEYLKNNQSSLKYHTIIKKKIINNTKNTNKMFKI